MTGAEYDGMWLSEALARLWTTRALVDDLDLRRPAKRGVKQLEVVIGNITGRVWAAGKPVRHKKRFRIALSPARKRQRVGGDNRVPRTFQRPRFYFQIIARRASDRQFKRGQFVLSQNTVLNVGNIR